MNHCASLKSYMMDKVQKKKIISLNFSHTVSSLLEFLTLEDETDRLSQNVSKE